MLIRSIDKFYTHDEAPFILESSFVLNNLMKCNETLFEFLMVYFYSHSTMSWNKGKLRLVILKIKRSSHTNWMDIISFVEHYAEKCSQPCQASFSKIVYGGISRWLFLKTYYLRCLIEFWIDPDQDLFYKATYGVLSEVLLTSTRLVSINKSN